MAKTQKEKLFDNVVVKSFTKNNKIFTLEKRSDNLFIVRDGYLTLSIHTQESEAEKKFDLLRPIPEGGDNDMSGEEQARATANKLRAETVAKEESVVAAKVEAKNQLAALHDNADLAKMYNDNAGVGAENLSGNAPYLKVHAAGKSTTNFLADGKKPEDGFFFYKPTQEQFESVTCHILTISKGFRAEGMNEKDGKKDMVFNQIMGGVIMDNGEYKPFIMFLTGVKLSRMWEFGKEVSRYTKAKPVSIPMFALTVKLTTAEEKTSYGLSWVINFEIVKQEGQPIVVLDPGEFQYLKDNVETTEELIASLIANKTAGEESEDQQTEPIRPLRAEGTVVSDGQVDPQNMPF